MPTPGKKGDIITVITATIVEAIHVWETCRRCDKQLLLNTSPSTGGDSTGD
jgi:hypothetical protein